MSFFPPLAWILLLAALALLALLVLLVFRRRRSARPPGAAAPMPGLRMSAGSLEGVWAGFARQIPWTERRQALGYPLSLVIGDNGSGKTRLIDRCGNWQGQQYRFHPSAIDDPLLQIYLGPRHLLLELSVAVLRDSSPRGHRALRRLWQRLPSPPTIVLAVNANDLLHPIPEDLRETVSTLFGKISVFSAWEGRPLPVTLAVTHMDAVEGFDEFGGFLERIGIPLEVDLTAGWTGRFDDVFEPLQALIPRALVECPADRYLRMLAFFEKSGGLLETLGEFLRHARESQRSTDFSLQRLCFVSDRLAGAVTNPFDSPSRKAKPPRRPLNPDLKIALGITLVGLVYLIGSYHYEKHLVTEALAKNYLANPKENFSEENYKKRMNPLFFDFSLDLSRDPLLTFLPGYFKDWHDKNNNFLLRQVRRLVLIPALVNASTPGLGDLRADYVLALLFATKDSDLGNAIEAGPAEWAKSLNMSTELIKDYVYFNREREIPVTEIQAKLFEAFSSPCHPQESGPGNARAIKDNILSFFTGLQTDITTGKASKEILQLKKRAEGLHRDLSALRDSRAKNFTHHHDISGLLQARLARDVELGKIGECRSALRKGFDELLAENIPQQLEKVAALSTGRDAGLGSRLSLMACLNELEAVIASDKPPASENKSGDGEFQLLGRRFDPDFKKLSQAVQHDSLRAIIRSCMKDHSARDGWAFFGSDPGADMAPAVAVRSAPGIDRRLSRAEFERNVRPVIEKWTAIQGKLALSPSDIEGFSKLLKADIDVYAERYAKAYFHFFKTLTPKISSLAGLLDALQQAQDPSSHLVSGLVAIQANTQFPPWADDEATAYLEHLTRRLTSFGSLDLAMASEKGAFPEFGKYQRILLKMQLDLESTEPKPVKPGTVAAGLMTKMQPLGRIALETMVAEDASYLGQVNAWLETGLLNEPWSSPFLAPVQKAKDMGAPYVAADIEAAWTDIWQANVTPLLTRFPFDRSAGPNEEATPEEIRKALHPKDGLFWQQFQQSFGGLLLISDGTWKLRPDLEKLRIFPEGMLEKLNLVQRVTDRLWNEQGEPKPLVLMIRAETLPAVYSTAPVPVVSLAYLRSGDVSVLGFNQQPHWQKFDLVWWASKPSSVGLKFQDAESSASPYADITSTDSAWNFYRLLAKSKVAPNKTAAVNDALHYQWSIQHPKVPMQKVKLTFSFEGDPWTPFVAFADAAK